MRVRYEPTRDRLILGSLDCHLKFFDSECRVVYNVKMPSEVMNLSLSSDGHHYAVGLNDGSLVVRSKQIAKEIDEEDPEQKLFK